jgi:nitrite reductase/ring-hydroxylating ferredoxin subunit
MTDRIVRCRVHNKLNDPCSGEAVDPDAELLICTRHLAAAQRLIRAAFQRAAKAGAGDGATG